VLTVLVLLALLGFVALAAVVVLAFMLAVAMAAVAAAVFGVVLRIIAFGLLALLSAVARKPREAHAAAD
jgi:hypothetical protein